MLKFDPVNVNKSKFTSIKTDWSEFFKITDSWRIDYKLHDQEVLDNCIIKLQKFILQAYKRSSTYTLQNKRTDIGEDDQAAVKSLIRLRNYYRRKYQKFGYNRYRIFRNILNNQIKAAFIEIRNNLWSKKLKLLNVKNKSLWYTLKSLQRKRNISPPLILNNQQVVYEPKQKAEEIAKNFHLVYSTAASLTSLLSPVVNDYINYLDEQDKMIPPINCNFLSPYSVLNIIKYMANKALGQNYTNYVEELFFQISSTNLLYNKNSHAAWLFS